MTVFLFPAGVHSFMERVEEKLSESTCQNPKLIRGMLEFCLAQKRLGMSGGWGR